MSKLTIEGPCPSPRTALCEPVSRESVTTAEDSSSSHDINVRAGKPTSHTAAVESVSTSSFSTTSLSRDTFPSIDAVPTPSRGPVSLPPEDMNGEDLPISSFSQGRKCVLGSFEDTDHSDSRNPPEQGRAHQRRAHKQSTPADVLSENTAGPPVLASDDAAGGPLTCSRAVETTAPLLLESASCLGFSASLSEIIPPPADRRPRNLVAFSGDRALPRSAAEEQLCLQNETNEGRRLSPDNGSAVVPCWHHTSNVIPRRGSASRSTQRRENASCTEGSGRWPRCGQFISRGPKPIDFLRRTRELSRREPAVESSSLTPSPKSCMSGASPCSLEECISRDSSAHQSEASHREDAGCSRKPTGARKVSTSRWEEANSEATTSLLPEKVCLQQAVQEHSAPVAKIPLHHYVTTRQRRSVNMKCNVSPHPGVTDEDDREEKILLQDKLPRSSREDPRKALTCGKQQPPSSSAADAHRRGSVPESCSVQCQSRPTGEQAAFVLNEVQQLQQLLGTKLAGRSAFRRKSLQHRFQQLQSALQQLLSSTATEGANSPNERAQLKNQPDTFNRAGGSSSPRAPSAHPAADLRSTTSKCEEVCREVNVAQKCGDEPSARNVDIRDGCTCLRGDQIAFVGGDMRLPHGRQEQTESATPVVAQSSTSTNRREEPASMATTLESQTRPDGVGSVTNHVQAQQAKAAAQGVPCVDDGVSVENGRGEQARELHAKANGAQERTVLEGEASCADAGDTLTGCLYHRNGLRIDVSWPQEKYAESVISGETVARRCRHRVSKTQKMASSTDAWPPREGQNAKQDELVSSPDAPTTREGQNVRQDGLESVFEVSLSNPRRNEYPESMGTRTRQPVPDRRSSRQHSSFTVCHAHSSRSSEHLGSEGGTRDRRSITNGRSQKGNNGICRRWVASHTPRRSPATVSGSSPPQEERPLSATSNDDKTSTSMLPRRRRKVVHFRTRRRRHRLCGTRLLARRFKYPVSPAIKLIPETYGGGDVAPEQPRVNHEGTFSCNRLHVDEDQISSSESAKTLGSTDFGVAASSSMGTENAPSEVPWQPENSSIAVSCSTDGDLTYQRDTTTSSKPSCRSRTAKEKPTDGANALSKANDSTLAHHSQRTTTASGNDGTRDTQGAHREHQPVTDVQGAACREETAQNGDAAASSIKADLVQAMCRFVQRQLEVTQKKDDLEKEDSVGRFPASPLQLCVAKDEDSWPAEVCEEAHSGLLLASCLGIMAGYGGGCALKDLCKVLLRPMTEQRQKGESRSAETPGRSESAEREFLQAVAESGPHDAAHRVLSRQTTGALVRRTPVNPGGRTAGRAATRKEHKQQQHRKHGEDQNGMQEGCRQMDSTSSLLQQKPTRQKTARCTAEAVTCNHSRHPRTAASQSTSREGGGIRWELLRTAKRAAQRKEKEESVVMDTVRTEHHSNSRGSAEGDTIREERRKSAVPPLHVAREIRLSSSGESHCPSGVHVGSVNGAGTSQSNSHNDVVPSTCSQLSTSHRNSVTLPECPLHERACSAKKRSQKQVSARHSCTTMTDDENLSAEELPSFEDIFSLPDLIPDAWYEEAEGSGSAGDSLNSGGAHRCVATGVKEAGQWVLEPETSALPFDAPEDKDNFQAGFFRMILGEKECHSPSDASLDKTPAAGHSFSQLPALWNVPDDLVELIDSVPGGSPSALRPPCALRLLPTSSSSSSPCSESTSRSSLNNSPTSSLSSSASSSIPSASSPSRASSAASSPHAEERSADTGVALHLEGKRSASTCSFKMSTHEQHSSAGMRWIFESSSEYDEETEDIESSNSEVEHMEAVTCKNQGFGRNHISQDDVADHSATTAETTLSHPGGVGFFQRALEHEGVRSRFNQPLPEFISLCRRKNSSSPNQRQKTTKVKENLCDRRSRTQPPTRVPAPDRAKRNRKQRRRHRRAECLKQRLAALHRDNLSHEEYMSQFARRMSLTAVQKVFCIEFTKTERCTLPYTIKSDDASFDTHIPAQPAVQCNFVSSPWSISGDGSPSSQPEAIDDEGSLCAQENSAVALCLASATPPVLTIEGCIADQLRRRGWVMNRLLSDSHFFDLKWKLTDVDEDYRSLRREQFFNHFQNNRVITTKGGLARSLRRLAVEEQVQVDLFFPRCYHLSSLDECSDFLLDYSRCEALSVLLAYLRCYQATPDEFHRVMVSKPLPSNSARRSAVLLLWMAYHIASVWLHELNPDLYLDRTESIERQGRLDPQRLEVFASHAWQFRSQTQGFLREWHAIAQCGKALNDAADNAETSEDDAAFSVAKEGKLFSWSTKNLSRAPLGSHVLRLLKQLQTWWPLWQLERGNANLDNLTASEEVLQIHDGEIKSDERGHDSGQQPRGNPDHDLPWGNRDPRWKQHNVWIMKPSSNSKASGIHCLNNPWEILRAGRGLSDRLIQKYVERPLLLTCRRKFDMRQWVLVRSFDPLIVYVFSRLYLRLCSETYDLTDLQNRFRHVSNRHLNKLNSDAQQGATSTTTKDTHAYPSSLGTSHGMNGAATGLDSCQPLAELEAMLAERTGNPHFFRENVMPQIRHIVLQTVRAARPSVISRPNSFELYGFDILLDEAYRAWLIEVNLSPACAAGADWQQQMVKQMTGELLDLLFRSDGRGALYGEHVNSADVGHWTLVFDESVDPREAVRAFPPIEPADKTLATGYTRVGGNPFVQFYSQPTHTRRGSMLAPRAAGGIAGLYPVSARAEDKPRSSQVVGSAAASWDKMVVVGEHLSRQAEAALNTWCRFTEARNRIISWWRRTAWKRRAFRRKKLALYEDIEVDYFFGDL